MYVDHNDLVYICIPHKRAPALTCGGGGGDVRGAVDDLQANTEYYHYKTSDKEIVWFWNILRSFTQEQKALFLQFVTGASPFGLGLISAGSDLITGRVGAWCDARDVARAGGGVQGTAGSARHAAVQHPPHLRRRGEAPAGTHMVSWPGLGGEHPSSQLPLTPCRVVYVYVCSFNQLDLPEYTGEEEMRKKLVLAMTECSEGFGFA
jgi:hypothetical protein